MLIRWVVDRDAYGNKIATRGSYETWATDYYGKRKNEKREKLLNHATLPIPWIWVPLSGHSR